MPPKTADVVPLPVATPKPGYKTTEFWLSLIAFLLSMLFASGLLHDGSMAYKIAGLAAMVITSMGYSVNRTIMKAAAYKAAA